MAQTILSPVNDHVFKRVFGDNLPVLADFLHAALGLPVTEEDLTVIDPNFLADKSEDKLGVLDVKVATKQYGLIDVEIQLQWFGYLWKRFQYYTARMYAQQLYSGEHYDKLNRAISIILANVTFLQESPAYHHRFSLYDAEHGIAYPDSMEIHLFEIPKRQQDGTPISDWLNFFAARTEEAFMQLAQTNSAIDKAWGVIRRLSGDERERELAERREKALRDQAAAYAEMYDRGMAKGKEDGIKIGEANGIKIGEANGIKVGKVEERRRVALSLRKLGASEEMICAATGYTPMELTQLAQGDVTS